MNNEGNTTNINNDAKGYAFRCIVPVEPTSRRAPNARHRGHHLAKLFLPVAVLLGLTGVGAHSAAALSATPYGFVCGTNHTVRTNWPNVKTDGPTLTAVYFRIYLFKYNGTSWTPAFPFSNGDPAPSQWFQGVSKDTGRVPLNTGALPGGPYYFVGMDGQVASQVGPIYGNLVPGYYKTVEEYSVKGVNWFGGGFVAGTDPPRTQTYCWT